MKTRFFQFLKFGVCIAFLCLGYGFLIEPRMMSLRHVSLTAPTGTSLKIALISDIHVGGLHMPAKRVEKITAQINAQNPDIIFIAGDYVNGHQNRAEHSNESNSKIDAGLSFLENLSAPMGIFAAMGNHDALYDTPYLRSKLSHMGINVLVNEAYRQNGLCIVGLADHDTSQEDPAVFEACDIDDAIIAIMHSPDSFEYLRSDTDLALAGHTHGGQINLPLLGRAVTATELGKPYAYGLQSWRGIDVFISAGLGTSIIPARFRSKPEIVIIEWRAQPI